MTKPRARHYWRNLIVFAFCTLAVGIVAGLAFVSRQGAASYVHPPRAIRAPDDTPAQFNVDYLDTTLITSDGVELSAWVSESRNGAVILVAHGFGGRRSSTMHALFARHGYGVVSWDARAQGESGGEACTMGYLEALDVQAALDHALTRNPLARVGAYGESMGGVTVIRAASLYEEIEAVVADSPFPTLEEMIDRTVPIALLRPLVRFFGERETGLSARSLRTIDDIRRISPRPVFLIQGEDDATVPPDSAQRLYDAAGEPRSLWTSPGVDHVGMRRAYPDEYERRLIAFFDAHLQAP
jgi:fermentation-respiration switch protein FrsA (DUF1100 family)